MALILVRPFYRINYIGKNNIPKHNAVVLCSNHRSFFDPLAISFGVRRNIYFMAKSEFFTDSGIFVKFFMKLCGVFPVKRESSDLGSVNTAAQLLSKNKIVGIFPQGKIVKDGTFEPKSGAALLAVKNQTPVLPVSIDFEGSIRPFSKITVTFGNLIPPPKDTSLKAARGLTKIIKERITAQLEGKHCP